MIFKVGTISNAVRFETAAANLFFSEPVVSSEGPL